MCAYILYTRMCGSWNFECISDPLRYSSVEEWMNTVSIRTPFAAIKIDYPLRQRLKLVYGVEETREAGHPLRWDFFILFFYRCRTIQVSLEVKRKLVYYLENDSEFIRGFPCLHYNSLWNFVYRLKIAWIKVTTKQNFTSSMNKKFFLIHLWTKQLSHNIKKCKRGWYPIRLYRSWINPRSITWSFPPDD